MPGDRLARHAEPGLDEAELAVAVRGWFRFMKSMSMVDHGSDTLCWVCRCSSGLRSVSSPVIHILAGENVCIQAITPMQSRSAFASSITWRIAPESVRTGLPTISALSRRRSAGPGCPGSARPPAPGSRVRRDAAAGEKPDLMRHRRFLSAVIVWMVGFPRNDTHSPSPSAGSSAEDAPTRARRK